ncbi:MAG TPA: hypothetical protein VLF20_04345 [Patescibacteria group bacterium]|nr:hypothetical protein [Patescibacteria group bacterium]
MAREKDRPLSPRIVVETLQGEAAAQMQAHLLELFSGVSSYNEAMVAFFNDQGGERLVAQKMFVTRPEDLRRYLVRPPANKTLGRIIHTTGLPRDLAEPVMGLLIPLVKEARGNVRRDAIRNSRQRARSPREHRRRNN